MSATAVTRGPDTVAVIRNLSSKSFRIRCRRRECSILRYAWLAECRPCSIISQKPVSGQPSRSSITVCEGYRPCIIHDLRLQSAKNFSATASWGNVIQMADLFFNGMYPYIDPGTGGKISGMIAAADKILSLADNDTTIVAGHGPLGNKADLTKYRDMLVTTRDRVEKLKSAGKSVQEAVAEKPVADLDAIWGTGIINGDQYVQIVYLTL